MANTKLQEMSHGLQMVVERLAMGQEKLVILLQWQHVYDLELAVSLGT